MNVDTEIFESFLVGWFFGWLVWCGFVVFVLGGNGVCVLFLILWVFFVGFLDFFRFFFVVGGDWLVWGFFSFMTDCLQHGILAEFYFVDSLFFHIWCLKSTFKQWRYFIQNNLVWSFLDFIKSLFQPQQIKYIFKGSHRIIDWFVLEEPLRSPSPTSSTVGKDICN